MYYEYFRMPRFALIMIFSFFGIAFSFFEQTLKLDYISCISICYLYITARCDVLSLDYQHLQDNLLCLYFYFPR